MPSLNEINLNKDAVLIKIQILISSSRLGRREALVSRYCLNRRFIIMKWVWIAVFSLIVQVVNAQSVETTLVDVDYGGS
jgi:hypothetical protein